MELIDKNKLLEGLKKLRQNLSDSPIVVIEDVESLVESLEVKEVNLDKEVRHYLLHEHKSPLSTIMHQIDMHIETQYNVDIENAFRSGFGLGLKVSKKGGEE